MDVHMYGQGGREDDGRGREVIGGAGSTCAMCVECNLICPSIWCVICLQPSAILWQAVWYRSTDIT